MIDYSELVEELREQARLEDEYPEDAVIKLRAADALEAQAKEIASLAWEKNRMQEKIMEQLANLMLKDGRMTKMRETHHEQRTSLLKRIEKLEAALNGKK